MRDAPINGDRRSHPTWCAGGHRCSAPAGEHRSEPITLARAGQRISVVVSLVSRAGRTHAEIRLSVALSSPTDAGQARELWALLRRLSALTRKEATR